MSNDLLNQIIACGIKERDARDAIGLARILKKIDDPVALSPCIINFVKNSSFQETLVFNKKDKSYLIFIPELRKRVSRIEFSFLTFGKKPLTKKEKFLCLSANQIRRRVQDINIKLFKPENKLGKHDIQNILERSASLKGYFFSDNLLIFEKKEFDAQFITAVCLYYYKKGATFDYLSDILFWEPK
jgi:hypothetical protein